MRLAEPLILACLLTGLAGCFNYRVGADPRPASAPLAPDAWPERDLQRLKPLADLTPDHVYDLIGPAGDDPPNPDYTILGTQLDAGGLLRVYESHDNGERSDFAEFFENLFYGFERNATYISSHWFDRFGQDTIDFELSEIDEVVDAVSTTQSDVSLRRPTAGEILLVGANISLGVPTEPAGDRGILVHLPALVGNEYEQGMVDRLERDGWTVLHVESDTTVRGPGFAERYEARQARRRRQAEIVQQSEIAGEFGSRSTRRHAGAKARREYEAVVTDAMRQAAEEIPMPDMGFEIRDGVDLDALGAVIAEYVDEHIADHAYATEAAIRYLDDTLPELADKPIVIIGFSAGSLAAPTVAARVRELFGDRLRAVVLVGSGAPIFDVAHLSSLTDGGLTLTPEGGPEPTDEQVAELRAAYLRHARLDPWTTSAAIRDLPVLHVYANDDTIVPSVAARTLNERLGDPDRLVYSGGHLGLFYFLPKQRERISRWITEHAHE